MRDANSACKVFIRDGSAYHDRNAWHCVADLLVQSQAGRRAPAETEVPAEFEPIGPATKRSGCKSTS